MRFVIKLMFETNPAAFKTIKMRASRLNSSSSTSALWLALFWNMMSTVGCNPFQPTLQKHRSILLWTSSNHHLNRYKMHSKTAFVWLKSSFDEALQLCAADFGYLHPSLMSLCISFSNACPSLRCAHLQRSRPKVSVLARESIQAPCYCSTNQLSIKLLFNQPLQCWVKGFSKIHNSLYVLKYLQYNNTVSQIANKLFLSIVNIPFFSLLLVPSIFSPFPRNVMPI